MAGGVGVASARQVLHDQHPRRDQVGDGARDAEGIEHPRVLARQPDLHHVESLEAEVHLLQDELGEQLDESARVGGAHGAAATLTEGGQQGHGPDVGLELSTQAGAADLDHDLLPGLSQPGGVHLGDRRRSQREVAEGLEDLVDRSTKLTLDASATARQ